MSARVHMLGAVAAVFAVSACETITLPPPSGGGEEPDPVGGPPGFTFYQSGDLEPGSGEGVADSTIYAPDIIFPVDAESFLNSQVWRPGGGEVGGDQCAEVNYTYPWRDNFCETRSTERQTLNCPRDRVHQGQDIRGGGVAVCEALQASSPADRTQIPVVAAEDGFISYVGSYTVNLRAGNRIYRYMHLNMAALSVEQGDAVSAGDPIGFLSNDFGGTPTTFHLHLELKQNIDGVGWTWVSPYMSLVRAYERRLGASGAAVIDTADGPAAAGD